MSPSPGCQMAFMAFRGLCTAGRPQMALSPSGTRGEGGGGADGPFGMVALPTQGSQLEPTHRKPRPNSGKVSLFLERYRWSKEWRATISGRLQTNRYEATRARCPCKDGRASLSPTPHPTDSVEARMVPDQHCEWGSQGAGEMRRACRWGKLHGQRAKACAPLTGPHVDTDKSSGPGTATARPAARRYATQAPTFLRTPPDCPSGNPPTRATGSWGKHRGRIPLPPPNKADRLVTHGRGRIRGLRGGRGNFPAILLRPAGRLLRSYKGLRGGRGTFRQS